ncbi:MAG: J domain-containing protein [Bacteroidia bacterium]|nr:J domain-containing protein [Bacteroidia bacterium]
MKGFLDYYKILGIERQASVDEIKQAYRGLALKYHPDKSQSELGRDRFLEITKAYEILKDEESRRKYNASYDRQFSASDNQKDYYATLQRVRSKRSSRYSRSSYTQRMRYRGTSSSATEGQPFNFTQKRERKSYNSYSARYAEQAVADYENTLNAYRRVTFVLRIFIACFMGYCLFLLADRVLSTKGEPMEISQLLEMKDRKGYINGIKVVTEKGTVYCYNRYEYQLLKERYIRIARTPFRGIISGVYTGEGADEVEIEQKRNPFGIGFYSIWLVLIFGACCFIFKEDPEMNFKLCTATIVLALIIYFSVFYI